MIWRKHSDLEGLHAFLGPSKYHWLNYDDEKLKTAYERNNASVMGTRLHEFAAEAIKLKIKQIKNNSTLNMYINDAIGFDMVPEQVLMYSYNCFGTADTISFHKNFLRIHDYKSGTSPASMYQLLIYAALFCLEYKIAPTALYGVELRIYKQNAIEKKNPTSEEIMDVMDKIKHADTVITNKQMEEIDQ